jgi:deoxyribodipyrimidine photo-lyase
MYCNLLFLVLVGLTSHLFASVERMKRTIIWFRNDLRIRDNPVLTSATQHLAAHGGEHLCIYCFDPRQFQTATFGHQKTGIFRAKFLLESVADLRQNLRKLGSELYITLAQPEDVLPQLVSQESHVFVHGDLPTEEVEIETAVEQRLKKTSKSSLHRIYSGDMLYRWEDLPYNADFSNLSNTFTHFREKVEKHCRVRPPVPTITATDFLANPIVPLSNYGELPSYEELGYTESDLQSLLLLQRDSRLSSYTAFPFLGGETAAWQRIQDWIFDKQCLARYFDTRNGLLGTDYSSKLSAYLSVGCVSVVSVTTEITRFQSVTGIQNKSTYWLIFELIWREFFRCLMKKYDYKFFTQYGMVGSRATTTTATTTTPASHTKRGARTNHDEYHYQIGWSTDETIFTRWKLGYTGWPLVDANMRELAATGWMSNRGRQIVASYYL